MEDSTRFKLSFTILSVGYIALGIFRFLQPDPNDQIICYLLGGVLLVWGVVRIAFYFTKDHRARVFRADLATGILLLIAGVYVVAKPASVAALIPVILGFAVVYDSILKLQYSFELKRTAMKLWWVLMVLALITALLGTLLIILGDRTAFMRYFLACVLIFDGVVNLLSLGLLSAKIKAADKREAKNAANMAGVPEAFPAPPDAAEPVSAPPLSNSAEGQPPSSP